ncbi:MAG: hypothetical protein PHR39_02795, partial [Actinomycetota bacterium]|nr:hypothetical protein [Actinomycetota bacterium]
MNIKYDIEPTVLYKKVNNQLSQLATVKFEGIKFPKDINFKLNLFTDGWKKEFKIDSKNRNNNYDFKNTYFEIYIPVVKEESKCRAVLEINDDKFEKDVVLKPRRMWEVHIQNFTHTDIGFTDLPSRVAEGYKDSIKSILNFYNETKDFDEDSIYKWNVETGYWLENALSGLSSNQLIQFKNMIKNSHAEITPLYVAHTSELNDEETLIRSLYFAFEFAKECGVRIETAMASDITGQPWILPQVFSKSGIKYFSTAVNATMAKALKLDRPFYWQSRDGSKILLLDTDERQAYQEGVMIGLHQDYNTVLKKLPAYLKDLEETDNFKFDLIALRAPGYPGDNTKPNVAVSYIVKEWNKIWEYPKLKISTYGSYFRKFEKIYGKSLKTYCGAWPDWWVSYHGAVAFEIGVNRNTHSDIITGERLSSILKTYNGKSFYYPESELKEVYKKMFLADEVDWSSYTSISEPDCLQSKGQRYENASFVYQAAINAEEIAENSKSCLAKMGKSNTKSSIVVSNCLDFERSEVAEVVLPRKLFKDKKGFKIFDSISGSEVKSQFIEPDIHDIQTGNARIALAAENIPPLGFKVFDFTVYDTDKGCEDIDDAQSGKIENCFYKVIYDNKTGQIEKIIDKDLDMDLIDTKSGFKFNQFIYESDTNKRFIDLSRHE